MTSFSLLVLKSHQMEKVRRFYATLGIEFQQEKHGKGPVHLAGQLEDAVLEIYPLAPDRKADNTTRVGFRVEHLNRILKSLITAELIGETEAKQTTSGLRALIRDPDGRAVELTQRIA